MEYEEDESGNPLVCGIRDTEGCCSCILPEDHDDDHSYI